MVASEDITAQSGMFSNIGDLPTATTGVSSGGSGLQRTGDVNALAKKNKYVPPAIDDLFTNATKKTKIKVDYSNVWKSIKYGVELFQELENRITRVNNNLDLLDSKMDGAMGTKKISYLQAQVKLYKEQVKLQKQYYSSLQKEKSILVTKLKSQGFTVNSQGNLTSYEEKLIKLEKAYADAQKKADNYDVYSGKSESKKKASEKKKKNLEKSAEKAKKALDDANATTSRYLELLNTEIPNAKKEWEDMTNAIKQANDEIERLKFEDNIYREEHAIESVNVKLERLATLTDRARIQAERYNGDKKIKYLNKESEYLKEQLKLNEQLVKQNSAEKEDYRYKLRQYGVKFDDQGNISNYGTTLNKYQNKEDYEKVKQYMDEFNDLAEAQRQAQNEVESLTNEIIELGYEIENIKVENKMKPLEIELQNSEAYAKKLANSLELVEMQIDRAYGKDKIELIKKQVELNEELAKIRRGDVLTLKEERNVLQDSLEKYGFQFTTKGDIKNVSKILDLLSDTPAYDHVAQLVEDWRTLHEDEIPDAEKAVADFEEAVKQAYDSQLDITTEIEDKITEMIEDQIDKRKEAIEKQSDAVVKALEKERDAYKALREEADYQNDYKEKVDELSEIAEQLEIARKDTSLSNRKKIKDLEKQLEEAQKELEDFVQDKIDSDVDKAYEDKIDAIEEESDKQIEALEDAWTESAIAQAVREALDTGIFTDLDGNIRNLNDAMLEFAQNSADHFSVMGQVIENDLIANLNVALDTVNNLSAIMNGLGIPEIRTAPSVGNATMGTKNLTVNGITINVPTTQGVDPATIASEVQRAVEDALKNVTEGL
jgi:chromosome segregation ATPase